MKRVVVTGMGVITPIGNDVETMWDSIKGGKHGIKAISRFDARGFRASLAAQVEGFDPRDYMEKSEIRRLDLYSQYAIAAAHQAVEDSGTVCENTAPERFIVCFGTGIGGIGTLESEHGKLVAGGSRKVSPLYIPMMIGNIAAGNIAIRYGARGSCTSIVTACSTGADAIGHAYRSIKHGYADAAIAGGSEAALTPLSIAGFANMTALTTSKDPNAASLPFDKRRSGFVMGEGAGALVLEEYEKAVERGAKIYGEILGYASTCDAYHITAPSPEGESSAAAIMEAYNEAGRPNGTIYINAHGTGTPLNDSSETKGIKRAFGNDIDRVLVSSTKSMTGHTLGAAGAIEAVISILALTKNVLPPTIGLEEPDPDCDLDYIPLVSRKAIAQLAMSVSLGFGGHNTCLAFGRVLDLGVRG